MNNATSWQPELAKRQRIVRQMAAPSASPVSTPPLLCNHANLVAPPRTQGQSFFTMRP